MDTFRKLFNPKIIFNFYLSSNSDYQGVAHKRSVDKNARAI